MMRERNTSMQSTRSHQHKQSIPINKNTVAVYVYTAATMEFTLPSTQMPKIFIVFARLLVV